MCGGNSPHTVRPWEFSGQALLGPAMKDWPQSGFHRLRPKSGHCRYRAASVGSAVAALERLGDRGFDLILLDCLIPGGGTDLVIERAARLGIPVVLMSGVAERAAAASAGRHKFITKPFTIDELLRTVKVTLRTEHS